METRTCSRCKKDQPIDQFGTYRPKAKPGKVYYQGYCKICFKELKRELTDQIRAYLKKLLTEGSCIRCGESDSRCLVWHHKDPKTKKHKMHDACASWAVFNRELVKVELLCANCHLKEHRGDH